MLKKMLAIFIEAWDMLLDISFPWKIDSFDHEEGSSNVLLMFPVVGLFIGFIAYLTAVILTHFAGYLAAAIIFGIIATIAYEFITAGRNFNLLISFLTFKFGGLSTKEALIELDDDFRIPSAPITFIAMNAIMLLRMVCFGILVYHGYPIWLIVVFTAAYAIQGSLASVNHIKSNSPLVGDGDFKEHLLWLITAGLLLFVLGFQFSLLVALGTIGSILFLSYTLKSYYEKTLDGVNAMIIGVTGYVIELIFLAFGIILLIKS